MWKRAAALVAALAACRGHDAAPTGGARPASPAKPVASGWLPRTGPGFEVTAPAEAMTGKRDITADTAMDTYEFGGGGPVALQVMTFPLPKGASAMNAIESLRDNIAKVGTITSESDVALGDTAGRDVRFTTTDPVAGKIAGRTRLLVQNGIMYQVQSVHVLGGSDEATDRFVESFRFTGPAKSKPSFEVVAQTPDADGWYTGHSPRGFSMRAPGPIIYREAPGEPGQQLYVLAAVKKPERIKLTAMCIVGGKQPKLADLIADSNVHRERSVGGRPAVEVDADDNASYLFVIDGSRSCVVTVAPASKQMPRQSELATKVFESFAFDP